MKKPLAILVALVALGFASLIFSGASGASALKKCSVCGSDKIITSAWVGNAVIHGGPNAVAAGVGDKRLWGRVCGNCGHVELFVEKPKELYDSYTKKKKS